MQTIDFSTKPICPECGGEISTEEINVGKDSVWCPTCRREMSFVEVADEKIRCRRVFPSSPIQETL